MFPEMYFMLDAKVKGFSVEIWMFTDFKMVK